jgi:hypothetical protein
MLNTITSLDTKEGRSVSTHQEKLQNYGRNIKADWAPLQKLTWFLNYKTSLPNTTWKRLSLLSQKKTLITLSRNFPMTRPLDLMASMGLFFKCWNIIKEDIYSFCFDFFNGEVDIKALNNSFIALIPKVNNPTTVNDFRPVSLMNSVVKIITKLLGERIQSFIIPLVHPNQYGFIKSRTIQDCLAWAFEYIHQCQHSKRKIVIIKLDFTKAFDTIEHSIIIQMMQSYGFQEKWIEWTMKILGSATTSILLNGVPGKNVNCERGVR